MLLRKLTTHFLHKNVARANRTFASIPHELPTITYKGSIEIANAKPNQFRLREIKFSNQFG